MLYALRTGTVQQFREELLLPCRFAKALRTERQQERIKSYGQKKSKSFYIDTIL